jgi:hypothetical protein
MNDSNSGAVYKMAGVAETLEVFDDKLTITPQGVVGFLSKGLKGTKTIPFRSITAIQFKKAGFTSGYLQFTIPGGMESRGGIFDAASDENTFMFGNNSGNNERAVEIKDYIETKIEELRVPKAAPSASLSDEISKLAALKAQGLLSDEEFQSAKARLIHGASPQAQPASIPPTASESLKVPTSSRPSAAHTEWLRACMRADSEGKPRPPKPGK